MSSQAYDLAKIERGGSRLPVWQEGDPKPTGGAGPVERTVMVRPLLPCEGCLHDEVCSIRPKLAALAEFRPPFSPDPAVHVQTTVAVTCDHYHPKASGHFDRTPSGEVVRTRELPPATSAPKGMSKRGSAISAAWTPEKRAAASQAGRERAARRKTAGL